MWWRSEFPIKVPVNSCQEIGWELEFIVTFPHAGTTANLPFFSVPWAVFRNITEVNRHIANKSTNLAPNFANSPNQFPNEKSWQIP